MRLRSKGRARSGARRAAQSRSKAPRGKAAQIARDGFLREGASGFGRHLPADQIVLFVVGDPHLYEVARLEAAIGRDIADAVNVGRIGLRTADGDAVLVGRLVDQDVEGLTDLAAELLLRDFRLHFHEAAAALFAHFIRKLPGQIVGGGASTGE